MDFYSPQFDNKDPLQDLLRELGRRVWGVVLYLGGLGLMIIETVQALWLYPFDIRLVVRQVYDIGVRTVSLSSLVALFTGMVVALQFIVGLKRFGLQNYAGQVVGLAITRELAPVLTALMMAARVGSGIAAELGSMQVSEQILAIRAMGGSPLTQLVAPRILVVTFMTPLLTVLAMFIGILGGLWVSVTEAGISAHFYFDQIRRTVEVYDFVSGIGKTFFFGFFIGVIACYQGLSAKKGTQAVGDATTQTVVISSVVIFVADFFLTKFFLLF